MAGILLEGYYGTDNLGDDCILLSVLNSINKIKKSKYFVDVMVNASEYSGYNELFSQFDMEVALYCNEGSIFKQLKCFGKNIKRYDFWVIGGGGLFPKESFKNLFKTLFRIKLAKLSGVKVCMYGIEINPVHQCINKYMWKRIIKNTAFIAARNAATKMFLDSVCPQNNMAFSDVTFLLDPHREADKQPVYKKAGLQKNYELWCPAMPWSEDELKMDKYNIRYRKICKQFAEILECSNNENIVFLPFYGKRDIEFIKDILDMVPQKDKYKIIDDSYCLKFYDKRELFQNAKKCVCMRYHSVLFALYFSVPFMAVSYSPKTSQLLSEIGLEDMMIEFGIRNSEFFYREFDMDYDELLSRYLDCGTKKRGWAEISDNLKQKAEEGESIFLGWLNNE